LAKFKEALFKVSAPAPAFIAPLVVFFTLLSNIKNYDFLWHLFLGRYIFLHKTIPDINIFYYTPSPTYGYDHSWLAQVIFYGLYSSLGSTGVVLLNCIIGAGIFFILYRIMEKRNPNLLFNVIILSLVFGAMAPYLSSFRPVIFTFLITSLFLLVLEKYQEQKSNIIFILPFLMVAWVNLHPGFLVGIILISIFLFSNIKNKRLLTLMIVLVLSIVAMLINPYFYKVYFFPFIFLKSFSTLKTIGEWSNYSGQESPFLGILVLLCVISFIQKRTDLKSFLLFAIFFVLGLETSRNISLFAIISVIIIRELGNEKIPTGKIKEFLNRFNLKSSPYQGILTVLLIIFVVISLSFFPFNKSRLQFNIDFSDNPVRAVELIKTRMPDGNIFSYEGWSGYLLWQLYPSYKIFFDAKGGFGDKQIKDYRELMRPGIDWAEVTKAYDIKTILLPKGKPLVSLLRESSEWNLVYSDTTSFLFLKK